MPTFADFELARKGGVPSLASGSDYGDAGNVNPTAVGYGNSDVDRLLNEAKGTLSKVNNPSTKIESSPAPMPSGPAPDRSILSDQPYQASSSDTYGSAFGNEITRTAAKALKGVVKSPVDMVKGLLGIPGQLIDTAKTAITQPKDFIKAYPDALKAVLSSPKAIFDPNTDPEEAASLAGQVALGEAMPGISRAAVRAVPDVAGPALKGIGKATSMTGRGLTAAAESAPARVVSAYGPVEALLHGDKLGLLASAIPPVLAKGGKVLSKVGGALERSSALEGLRSFIDQHVPAAVEHGAAPSAADIMRENVAGARETYGNGSGVSHKVANNLNDVPNSSEIPYKNTKPTTNKPTYQADIDAEKADLESQGFGPGAIDKLVGKKSQKAAAKFSEQVALEGLRNIAENRPGYSLQDVATGPRITGEAAAKAKNAKPFKGRQQAPSMQALRALLGSMDDAGTIARSVQGSQK